MLARSIVAELRTIPRGGSVTDSTRRKLATLSTTESLFLLTTPMFFSPAFGQSRLVRTPPVAEQSISRLDIEYTWDGLGTPVKWSADVSAGDSALVTIRQDGSPPRERRISGQLLQALAPAMTDFHPIAATPKVQPCFDNTPDWKLTVTFHDGRKVQLVTNQSNVYSLGGPYQMELDGQRYLQLSSALVVATGRLAEAAGFTLGQPRAWSCRVRESVLDLTFPKAGN
jgi:hypothetical protein